MSPLYFQPLLKQIRWGGRRLGSVLGKPIGPEPDYAESWELADHGADQSVVADGPLAGRTLHELVREHDQALLGKHAGIPQFPLLLKFLDCRDVLSVQVHPNDAQANEYQPGANGKTEAWVVIDAEPESQVFAGLKSGVTRGELQRALVDGSVQECLHAVEVQPGDCIFIPAGTVHAIGPGILLAEVQQMSDLTFRLYDWGRLGTDGKPRDLHIDESLACTDFSRGPVTPVEPQPIERSETHRTDNLVTCPHFALQRHEVTSTYEPQIDGRFHALMVLDGEGCLSCGHQTRPVSKGQSILVPASCDECSITTPDSLTLLDAFLPDAA